MNSHRSGRLLPQPSSYPPHGAINLLRWASLLQGFTRKFLRGSLEKPNGREFRDIHAGGRTFNYPRHERPPRGNSAPHRLHHKRLQDPGHAPPHQRLKHPNTVNHRDRRILLIRRHHDEIRRLVVPVGDHTPKHPRLPPHRACDRMLHAHRRPLSPRNLIQNFQHRRPGHKLQHQHLPNDPADPRSCQDQRNARGHVCPSQQFSPVPLLSPMPPSQRGLQPPIPRIQHPTLHHHLPPHHPRPPHPTFPILLHHHRPIHPLSPLQRAPPHRPILPGPNPHNLVHTNLDPTPPSPQPNTPPAPASPPWSPVALRVSTSPPSLRQSHSPPFPRYHPGPCPRSPSTAHPSTSPRAR